ncbi:MAG: hypothetical protein H0U19_04940 [Acidobacteria bacterium]|nr:hypothetical protein [Acidobacteriota bacterium]
MLGRRDQKVRVLQALERAIAQFRTRRELWPLRVPADPLPLDDIIQSTLAEDAARFDPRSLRSRSLLHFTWDDETTWELWLIALPNGLKVYCDSDPLESRILATGRRDSEIETDRLFLELLGESAGEHFGIGISGGAPQRVRSSIDDTGMLIDFFVDLFEVAGMEASVRDGTTRSDFREDVEHWLERARRPG